MGIWKINLTIYSRKINKMKTKIFLFVIALISTIFLSSCCVSSSENVEKNTEAKMVVDHTITPSVEVVSISGDDQVLFYRPNLNLLFSNAKTKKEKEAVWLKVKDEGDKNWLKIKDIYEKKWLTTKDSAEKAWLAIRDQALDTFKKEDPDAYQQFVSPENSGSWKALNLFMQTTTSVAYKKYEKTQFEAWENSQDIQLKAWENSQDIQLKAWKIYDDAK
jgi:hypothetical protein